tara:strand:- start:26 stop:355 length:330 start_codon:yes stop_codon:yes gene_type:complete
VPETLSTSLPPEEMVSIAPGMADHRHTGGAKYTDPLASEKLVWWEIEFERVGKSTGRQKGTQDETLQMAMLSFQTELGCRAGCLPITPQEAAPARHARTSPFIVQTYDY